MFVPDTNIGKNQNQQKFQILPLTIVSYNIASKTIVGGNKVMLSLTILSEAVIGDNVIQ